MLSAIWKEQEALLMPEGATGSSRKGEYHDRCGRRREDEGHGVRIILDKMVVE
jgi:hypothetical protein